MAGLFAIRVGDVDLSLVIATAMLLSLVVAAMPGLAVHLHLH